MNEKERMKKALSGNTPDQVPIGFFYNCDYKAKCAGISPQAYIFGTNEDRYRAMAATYQRHREDWIHADPGISFEWESKHKIVWDNNLAYVETTDSRQRDLIRMDLTLESARERSHGPGLDYGYSFIKLDKPLEKIRNEKDLESAEIRSAEELINGGFLDPPLRLVESFGDRLFITLPMGNIFFNSVYFFGLEEGLLSTLMKPTFFKALLELNTAQELEVVKAAGQIGLDGIWLAEMLISADIVSPRVYKEMIAPLHRQIVQEASRRGLKTIAYLTGDCLPLLNDARNVGYDGVIVENQDKRGGQIDIAEVRARIGPEICVFGNLDPVELLTSGDDQAVRQEVKRQIHAAGQDGAFVMHSNIISLPVTMERIDQVIKFTREYGQYPLRREIN